MNRSDQQRQAERTYHAANRERRNQESRDYRTRNLDAIQKREREHKRRERAHLRGLVLDHYGHACACCGASQRLAIDHIKGDGAQHRMEIFGDSRRGSTSMYRWLVSNDFPDGFQTLCLACNNSKSGGEQCRLDHGPADWAATAAREAIESGTPISARALARDHKISRASAGRVLAKVLQEAAPMSGVRALFRGDG